MTLLDEVHFRTSCGLQLRHSQSSASARPVGHLGDVLGAQPERQPLGHERLEFSSVEVQVEQHDVRRGLQELVLHAEVHHGTQRAQDVARVEVLLQVHGQAPARGEEAIEEVNLAQQPSCIDNKSRCKNEINK